MHSQIRCATLNGMTPLQSEVIALARSYIGLRETTPNSGPVIDQMLAHVRCRPGEPWCAAFVCWCIHKAAATVPPLWRGSAGALRLLERNAELEVNPYDAKTLLQRGEPLVFVQRHTGGKGHCGFAVAIHDTVETIEGNTRGEPGALHLDRDGQGVYLRNDRWFGDFDYWLRIA